MTDNLFFVGLVFVLCQEGFRAGEGDLVDIFINFALGHTDTVINEFYRLIFRADKNVYFVFVAFWLFIFADDR